MSENDLLDLYSTDRQLLVRHAERLLGARRAAAEDVVQEAFLRAHRSPAPAGPGPAPRAWLYTVVRNAAIDELRKQRRLVPYDPEEQTGAQDGTDAVAARREELREVIGDLHRLAPRQREALMAHVLEALPHAAVAARLGTSVGASKQLVGRGRASLVAARQARAVPAAVTP